VVLGYMPVASRRQRPGEFARALYSQEYERVVRGWEEDPGSILSTMWAGNFSIRRADYLALAPTIERNVNGYHEDLDFGLACAQAGLTGAFDRSLRAVHHYERDPAGFLRDARSSGANLPRVHQRHAEQLGELRPDFTHHDLRAPLRPLVRAGTRLAPVRALARAGVAAAGALHLFTLERIGAGLLWRMEQGSVARGSTGPAAHDLLVLCYHAVSESWPADLSITPGALESQLGLLVRRGYRGATFSEAVSGQRRGRTVVVTFDDPFESVHRLAWPILDRLGLPATVFVPTRQGVDGRPMAWPGIDQWLGGPHEAELRAMSPEQLRELAAAGWEIGAHSRTHPRLPELNHETLARELRGSKEDCERELGIPCRTLAYPFGAADERVRGATRAAGFAAAAGLSSDLSDRGLFYWPRVGIYGGDDARRFRLKVARSVRRLRATSLIGSLFARRGRPEGVG
jgi:peptidoglycan/xylan/chitin deacetylase (PgdA/CDA1 family)